MITVQNTCKALAMICIVVCVCTGCGNVVTVSPTINGSSLNAQGLSNITASSGDTSYTISPEFNSSHAEYTVFVPECLESVSLAGIPENDTYLIIGDNPKIISLSGKETAATITVKDTNGNKTVYVVTFMRESNRFKDGSFSKGISNLKLFTNGSGAATLGSTEGMARISIIEPGAKPWDIGVLQEGFDLENGVRYRLTFEAYATKPLVISTVFQRQKDPWDSYYKKEHTITTESAAYSMEFIMAKTRDSAAGFNMHVGGSSADCVLFVDNVRFVKIE